MTSLPIETFKAIISRESLEQLRARQSALEKQIQQDKGMMSGCCGRMAANAERLSELLKVVGPKALLEAAQI